MSTAIELVEVRVPDIGDFSQVPIVEITVSVGDTLAADDTVVVLESDKATLDVPTPMAGKVVEVKVSEGEKVGEGSVLITLEPLDGTVAAQSQAASPPAALEIATPPADPAPPQPLTAPQDPPAAAPAAEATPDNSVPALRREPGKPVYASPSIRRYARTLGVAIDAVKGSGTKGRILRADVEAFVKAQLTRAAEPAPASVTAFAGLPPWPNVDFEKFGPTERLPLSRIVRISGPALARNAMVIPHVTNFDRADVTDLEEFRKTLNGEAGPDDAKVTLLAFAVKAVVAALKAYPRFNSSLDGDDLVMKQYWNIGVAADTPDGLVVPVVHAADQKGIRDIAADMVRLAAAARAGKLQPSEMQGATFTISSLGGVGGTNFTPIINAPEVAILGMTRAQIEPVWDGAAFHPRLMQPISLSWDHRVVDGVAAARFLGHVARTLGDFRRIAV